MLILERKHGYLVREDEAKTKPNSIGLPTNTVAPFPPSGKNGGIFLDLIELDCFISFVLTEECIVFLELTPVAMISAFFSLLTSRSWNFQHSRFSIKI